jgi:hypothetical protein
MNNNCFSVQQSYEAKNSKPSHPQTTMTDYRQALLQHERNEVVARAQKQLQSIQQFEDGISARLHDSVVKEIAGEFKEKFSGSQQMQDDAFSASLKQLEGQAAAEVG